ncbi:MAG: glycosyltransferase family 39 protein [Xanthomonadaceae bacterium]|nr:glycosyltransferase family 39 protein [Xanthomonadaceae bacterium]
MVANFFFKIIDSPKITTEFLPTMSVLGLRSSFVLMLMGLGFGFKSFASSFIASATSTKKHFAALVVLSLVILVFVVPRAHRLYYDEHIYENIAQSIHSLDEAVMANDGYSQYSEYKVFTKFYNKQPNAHPYFISLFFGLFGVNDSVAFFATNFAFFVSLFLIFILGLKLFRSEHTALVACYILISMPMVMRWSNTVSAEIVAMMFGLLSVVATFWFKEERSWPSLFLFVGAVTFGIQVRPESLLILLPIAFILFLDRNDSKKWEKFDSALLFGIILLIPHFIHLMVFRNNDWGNNGGDKFSLSIFLHNIKVNGPFYFVNYKFPALVTVLALGSYIAKPKEYWKSLVALSLWFFPMWGIFLFFYAGSYEYGVDVRYSLISAVPLALLGAQGFVQLSGMISDRFTFSSRTTFMVLGSAFLVYWLPFTYHLRLLGEEPREARFDAEYARQMQSKLPEDSVVLTHNVGMWLVFGQSAAQGFSALDNTDFVYKNLFVRHTGGVYFHWNFWCNTADESQKTICTKILDKYQHKLFHETTMYRKRYAIYELLPESKMKK